MGVYSFVRKLYNTQVDATGLSVFRIFYGIILLAEILQIIYFQHLIYDPIPYIQLSEVDLSLFLFAWAISAVLIIIGLFTRIATIVNYVITLATFSAFHDFEYHLDYSMTGINFLLMFMPIARTFSIDYLIQKLKYFNLQTAYFSSPTVSVLNNYLLVVVGVGLVYFDSIFHKLASDIWLGGLGFWLPASMPMASYLDLSFFLNNKFLSLLLGYVTVVFELVFIFFIWFKKVRPLIVYIGLALHVGILIAYPIPWFALGVAGIYLLLLPDDFWNKIKSRLRKSKPTLYVYYDRNSLFGNQIKVIINHFDVFNKIAFVPQENDFTVEKKHDIIKSYGLNIKEKKFYEADIYLQVFKRIWFLAPLGFVFSLPGLKKLFIKAHNYASNSFSSNKIKIGDTIEVYREFPVYNKGGFFSQKVSEIKIFLIFIFICFCILGQLLCINQSRLIDMHINSGLGYSIRKKIEQLSYSLFVFNKKALGITRHPVFMDQHFKNYNHIIAITFINGNKETLLPIINEKGQAGFYNTGRQWVNWTFRIVGPEVNEKFLKEGVRRYTAFWAKKNNVSLDNAVFSVKVKRIDVPKKWEMDFLKRQFEKPWINAGTATWKSKEYFIEISDIEKIP